MNANKRLCIKLIHCGNMNIVNPQDNLNKSNFFIPMGLFALANQLKRNCFDAEIIHFDLELGHDIEEILDFAALDAVGMDCHWVNQSLVVLEMARIIKRIKPGIFTFLGGYTASFFAEEILTGNGEIDAIIRGDGEIPLLELCEVLNRYLQENHTLENCTRNSLELQQVSNLVWRKTTGVIISNDWSYVATAKDLDQLDFAGLPATSDPAG